MEDLRSFLQSHVPAERLSVDWTDPLHDHKQRYAVDYRINNLPRPLFIFALPSNSRVKDATINLLTFENWNLKFQSLGIFEDQGQIDRVSLAKFTDVCDKAFSSLDENPDRIAALLQRVLETAPIE
jgi:hypothetical protein